MITLHGQLIIRTVHGRNGDFNVGRLMTSIGEFVLKNPELEQYPEGKYDGEFIITEIKPSMYMTSGRMVIENRAHLGGMTLSNIDTLSDDDASRLTPQEPDPVDEEHTAPSVPVRTEPASPAVQPDPLVDTTPFGVPTFQQTEAEDAALFGDLWPLGFVVKLDATVTRLVLRKQSERLGQLGYIFEPLTQNWQRITD